MSHKHMRIIFGLLTISLACTFGTSRPTRTPTPVSLRDATTGDPATLPDPGTTTVDETLTETPVVQDGLPDLTLYASVSMQDYHGSCIVAYTPLVSQV